VTRLGELYEEVGRREARLAELGAKKVTRALAEEHPDLRPIVLLLSECHELFGHEFFGETAGELAVKMTKRSRKTAIVLWDDTQSSRKAAIPPQLVELVSVNVCFAVKSWRSNDGFLGDGSFAAGIRATELRPGRDRGRSLVTGISSEQFELLAWYFIEVDDDTGHDAAAEVIARAMSAVDPRTLDPASSPAAGTEPRDLLGDVAEVTGAERVKLRDLAALLRTLAPGWARYRNLTAKRLGEDLGAAGVRVVNSSGTPYLDPADLRRVLAGRGE
jgi:S-DNA-T family DNA segregation ATPase FtsK/SpoIIIE